MLNKKDAKPIQPYIYMIIANKIVESIELGAYSTGKRLPSVREIASQFSTSTTTALKALRYLEDKSYVVARPKSGFFVNMQNNSLLESIQCNTLPQPYQLPPLDEQTELYLSMVGDTCRIRLDLANGDESLYPVRKVGLMMRQLSYRQPEILGSIVKGTGYRGLKEQIAIRALGYGCHLNVDDIIITNGCIEAMSLSLRAILSPGDCVAVDSPSYFVLLQMLRSLAISVVEVPTDHNGYVDLNIISQIFKNKTVKAYVALANVNNPTGRILPDDYKREIAHLADENNIIIIEDDIFGDTAFTKQRPRPMRAFSSNVILCSGFSKTISPGLRIGWVNSLKWRKNIASLKYTSSLGTSQLPQIAIAEILKNGGYEAHLRRLRRELLIQITLLRQTILEFFPVGTSVSLPEGGYVVWVELPKGYISTRDLFIEARKNSIGIAPGYIFAVDDKYDNCFRLNAGFGWNDETKNAIKLLASLINPAV
jgi:DNA-binding transcriptional MocR family regulator